MVTPHERPSVSDRWGADYSLNSFTRKLTPKPHIIGPLWGESINVWQLPLTKGQ